MQAFFYICGYLDVTPQEFFDVDNKNPERLREIIQEIKTLDDESLGHLLGFIRKMKSAK